jgi:hypothetical protein
MLSDTNLKSASEPFLSSPGKGTQEKRAGSLIQVALPRACNDGVVQAPSLGEPRCTNYYISGICDGCCGVSRVVPHCMCHVAFMSSVRDGKVVQPLRRNIIYAGR